MNASVQIQIPLASSIVVPAAAPRRWWVTGRTRTMRSASLAGLGLLLGALGGGLLALLLAHLGGAAPDGVLAMVMGGAGEGALGGLVTGGVVAVSVTD